MNSKQEEAQYHISRATITGDLKKGSKERIYSRLNFFYSSTEIRLVRTTGINFFVDTFRDK